LHSGICSGLHVRSFVSNLVSDDVMALIIIDR
jgi:hypothetical protein